MRKLLLTSGTALVLVACGTVQAEPPTEPPTLTAAPPVATSGLLSIDIERTIPMTVPELRAFLKAEPLIGFLRPTESIANPVASEVLAGTWPEPGAARWLRLADGHYVVERVLENEPDFFRYQVFVFTNATGRGVEQIVGEQRFVPIDGGTRFEWSYNIRPRNFLTRIFVKREMDEIERFITSGLDHFAEAARMAAGG